MSPFLALGAACCWGVGDFFGGLMSRRQSVLAVVWISQIVGLLGVAVVVLARGSGLPDTSELLWALAAGVFTVGTLIGFFGGMARGPMSLVAPISATGVSIPVLVGIAGGERPSALQLAGIVAACAGIVLAARESGDAGAVGLKRVHVCVWFALLAAVCGGSQLVSLDRAAEHDAIVAVLVMRVTSVAIFSVAALVVRPAVARETLPCSRSSASSTPPPWSSSRRRPRRACCPSRPCWPASTRSSPSRWPACGWASGLRDRRPSASAWPSRACCW